MTTRIATPPHSDTLPADRRRGALLLEVLLALAVFVGAGLAILTVLERSSDAMARVRDRRQACDLATSALARIEAGIDTPETLDGPVPAWEDLSDGSIIGAGGDARWELDIRTEVSQFEGLTKVTVEAIKRGPGDPDGAPRDSFILSQLVRIPMSGSESSDPQDEIGKRQRDAARVGARVGAPVGVGAGAGEGTP
ncbi:MAG: hypothetical protein IT435_03035 [Phycisphaerales bacterium]|nr:hypothetical protein [Phycisphaerales bacterium]